MKTVGQWLYFSRATSALTDTGGIIGGATLGAAGGFFGGIASATGEPSS